MPNHLSVLGIIHTAISIIAILVAVAALVRHGKVAPANALGKWYIGLTVFACLTSLPIMRTGHPTAGHFLAVMILVLLPLAIYARFIFKKLAPYVQVIIMSATLFFSMIPTTVETLTRLPISHPLAEGPDSPLVKMTLLFFFLMFLSGTAYQVIKLRNSLKKGDLPFTPSL